MANTSDPSGLDSDGLLGSTQIETPPPARFDGSTETEIALAISRAVDSLASLTKFLPLPAEAADRFRDTMFRAWSELIEASKECRNEAAGVDQPEFP